MYVIRMYTVCQYSCLSCPAAKKLPKGTSGPQRTATGSREPYVSDRQPQQQSVSPQYHSMAMLRYVENYEYMTLPCMMHWTWDSMKQP